MSYANDGHSRWLEDQLGYACSELGREVANILGYAGGGLYNSPIKIEKVNWKNQMYIEVSWSKSLSNWDFMSLTRLWVECARRMVRVSISGGAPGRLKLMFHKRHQRDGSAMESLPDAEELIAMVDYEWRRTKTCLP